MKREIEESKMTVVKSPFFDRFMHTLRLIHIIISCACTLSCIVVASLYLWSFFTSTPYKEHRSMQLRRYFNHSYPPLSLIILSASTIHGEHRERAREKERERESSLDVLTRVLHSFFLPYCQLNGRRKKG